MGETFNLFELLFLGKFEQLKQKKNLFELVLPVRRNKVPPWAVCPVLLAAKNHIEYLFIINDIVNNVRIESV